MKTQANSMKVDNTHKPILVDLSAEPIKAMNWAEENRQSVMALLAQHGAVLIRGLRVISAGQFGKFLTTIFDSELLNYEYRSTPRKSLKNNVYTATEYHADKVIQQHNENAYSNSWPRYLGFTCTLPSDSGGATPICDSRTIYSSIPEELRNKFEEKGVMYVRNYSDIDLPWQEVFNTQSKESVEQYCKDNGIEFEWRTTGLHTRQTNNAIVTHPESGEKIWFNQAHLFHHSNLGSEFSDELLNVIDESVLPRNAYYGDGSSIDETDLALIRGLYEQHQFKFDWQKNDILLLDNMMFSHGRESFTGKRQVLVGMTKLETESIEHD